MDTITPSPLDRRTAEERSADERLVARASRVLAVPRDDVADSFVLHAPLELCARVLLLDRVDVTRRPVALARIRALADGFDSWGSEVGASTSRPDTSTATSAATPAQLVDAVRSGDLDRVDATATTLLTGVDDGDVALDDVVAVLGPAIAASTSAAGHAPILLALLGRVRVAVADLTTLIARQPLRELARHPDWALSWFDGLGRGRSVPSDVEELTAHLAATPSIGPPPSTSIHPTMAFVETRGVLADVVGALAVGELEPAMVEAAIARVATASMLQEPDDHAAYGWSHALTMPQGVLRSVAPHAPELAAVVAMSHLVAFRAALGRQRLDLDARTAPADAAPDGDVVATLASQASAHHDAHLVKYTLACLDAAEADPAAAGQHLAAAARLQAWWADRDAED